MHFYIQKKIRNPIIVSANKQANPSRKNTDSAGRDFGSGCTTRGFYSPRQVL